MVLRQTWAAGSVQRHSEPSAKHRVHALRLKGKMFVKLHHGLRRSSVKTPKNTLGKYCTFLPVTARDGSASVPSCLVVLLKFSSSLHPAMSHVLPHVTI